MKEEGKHSLRAFTMIELIALLAMLMVPAAMALPFFARAKCRCQHINCVNNLKQIGVAFLTWGLDNGERFPMQVSVAKGGTMELVNSRVVFPHFEVMSNELSTPKILFCPSDSIRERKPANTFNRAIPPSVPNSISFASDTNLSYFVGVEATHWEPNN